MGVDVSATEWDAGWLVTVCGFARNYPGRDDVLTFNPEGLTSPPLALVGRRWFVYGQLIPPAIAPLTRGQVLGLANRLGLALAPPTPEAA